MRKVKREKKKVSDRRSKQQSTARGADLPVERELDKLGHVAVRNKRHRVRVQLFSFSVEGGSEDSTAHGAS